MNQQLEIEYKNLLTEEEFLRLLAHFQIDEKDLVLQKNHYFDTPDFLLKEQGCALRIREKGSSYELTLKEPAEEGLLETNEKIDEHLAKGAIEFNILPQGDVTQRIAEKNIEPSRLRYFGTLSTLRKEIPYKDGLLVFDKSSYFKKVDFELEYEVKDPEKGKRVFFHLLNQFGIPVRKTENKILRFYLEMPKK